jgi:dolichol-phosphate mannosyltransferase
MRKPASSPRALDPQLSVVVPTRNEAANVEELVRRLAAALDGVAVEVIFVDDSTDGTPELLDELARGHPAGAPLEVRAIVRPPEERTGLGSAVVTGLKAARATAICVMDSDLQHPAELIPQMMRACELRGLDVAVASRYMPGGSASGLNGPARRLVSLASRALAQALFREARQTSDPLSGFFVCRRSVIDGLEFRPIGFKVLLEVLVCAPDVTVGDVPLRFGPRHGGRSNASIAQGAAFLRHLWGLLIQVPGSARSWKYAMVGGAGLAVYVLLLVAGPRLGLSPYQTWALAFIASLSLNWQVNRVFTFADVASPFTPGRSRPVYLPAALLAGLLNLVVFSLLVRDFGITGAGLAGALTAMLLNYLVHRRLLRRPPRLSGPGMGREREIGDRISRVLGVEKVVFLRPDADEETLASAFAGMAEAPRELLRAGERRRGVIIAETPSHRPQARHDIGLWAWLGLPVLEGRSYLGMVVAHRHGQPFSAEDLDRAMMALRSSSRDDIRLPVGSQLEPEAGGLPEP